MILPSGLALTLATLLATSSAQAEPNIVDTVHRIANTISSKALKVLGATSCPAPSFLPSSCANGQSPQNVNGCCTNTPGGYLLQTQFWDAQPATGPSDSWTLHGLWPDNCDGTYEQFCDPSREYTDIRGKLQANGPSDLVPYMDKYWKDYQGNDEQFWEHEFWKHGTCISTLNTTCYGSAYTPYEDLVDYFERAVSTFKALPTYTWLANAGIVPSTTKTYTLAQLQAVAKQQFGYEIVWNCKSGVLNEAWYGYLSQGPINGGRLIPTDVIGSGSNCPQTGIKYIPKGTTSTGGGGSTTTPTDSTSSTLNVIVGGKANGCLISSGKWYTSGTCASYRLAKSATGSDSFTMSTSKGPCAVSSAGSLSCADGNTASIFTKDSSGFLAYSSSPNFRASQVASGQTQVGISTQQGSVSLKINVA